MNKLASGFCPPSRWALMALLGLLCAGFSAGAGDVWPAGASIAEGSRSPDGRFAILLPSREEALAQEEDEVKNLLVDLPKRAELAVIEGAHFYPFRNHRDLAVFWAPDSSWCVVTYEERFGFKAITLLVHRGPRWEQIDLGTYVRKVLDAEIARQAGSERPDSFATAEFRTGEDGEIHVSATCTTNPKALPEVGTYEAVFRGTFDIRRGEWTASEARKVRAD